MAGIERARLLRKNQTWAEALLWRWLRDRRFCDYKFRRQHHLGVYYLDFFCEEARLAVELDGFGHGHPDQIQRDEVREAFLTSRGIKVLRFWNSYLRRNPQSVRDSIFRELQARAAHRLLRAWGSWAARGRPASRASWQAFTQRADISREVIRMSKCRR